MEYQRKHKLCLDGRRPDAQLCHRIVFDLLSLLTSGDEEKRQQSSVRPYPIVTGSISENYPLGKLVWTFDRASYCAALAYKQLVVNDAEF